MDFAEELAEKFDTYIDGHIDGFFNGYNAAINDAIHKFRMTCDNIKSVRSDGECFLTEKNIVDILENMIKL